MLATFFRYIIMFCSYVAFYADVGCDPHRRRFRRARVTSKGLPDRGGLPPGTAPISLRPRWIHVLLIDAQVRALPMDPKQYTVDTVLSTRLAHQRTEKIRAVIVDNFPALGKASVFRFLECAQQNPEGVCSLPTAKTPEYFINCVERVLKDWVTLEIQRDVARYGLRPERPVLRSLTFVQIDEFYPISPDQANSFFAYVNEYYIKGSGLDPAKALLIDFTMCLMPLKDGCSARSYMAVSERFPDAPASPPAGGVTRHR